MDNLAREMKREYYREWRAANRDKIKQYNETYWRKKALERKNERQSGKEDADEREAISTKGSRG